MLTPGSPVPDLQLTDQDGNPISLAALKGQKLIVFIYAQNGTGTCLKEACSLRDGYEALAARGYRVIGISPDSEKSHRNFIAKQQLPFTLISDPDNALVQAFGAWGEKSMYGKTYMGMLRTTFLVDEQGIITHVIDKVKSSDHANQILDVLG
jgi:peroxiredoxin Q/BCP